MNAALKAYLVEQGWVAADADDATLKSTLTDKLAAGELGQDKYLDLLSKSNGNQKADELADKIAEKTATSVATALAGPLTSIADALKARKLDDEDLDEDDDEPHNKAHKPQEDDTPFKSEDVMKMGSPDRIRVKSPVESYTHTPTALVYKDPRTKMLGLYQQPMEYNGKQVNQSTDRSRYMSATWLKLQLFPDLLSEHEKETVQYILDHEKFLIPNRENDTEAKFLTEAQKAAVKDFNFNFYRDGRLKTVIDDSTSGGENAIPEFFDMDMIVTPTLAEEDIPSFCNVVPVPRGTAAQNFIIGRPTISAANTEGSAVGLFSTSGFITNHDTSFFRAAGFIKIGKNFAADAHPRLVSEIQVQYMNSVKLWLNEQIMGGDGTTEPQGVLVASGTTDVTPANPTTGALTLNDAFDLLFGVGKAHRNNGGRQNAIYVMSDTTYQRFRRIATGVTGDTRLVFGDDVESYRLFNHPVLIEEASLGNTNVVFMQAKGYRLYMRQGPRFIREDRGDTLVRQNAFIVGVDVRAGGQLDEGAYCAIVDSAPA